MSYVRNFTSLSLDDLPLVGGKNAALGELHQALEKQGLRVPPGFAVTAEAYREILALDGLGDELAEILAGLSPDDVEDLRRRGSRCRELVFAARWPEALARELTQAYQELEAQHGSLSVAVRSSATAEDLPEASFAGQHDSVLNVQGPEALEDAVRRCLASLFTDRAIRYREHHGFEHMSVFLSVGVMKMIRADLAASGVAFSVDTESGHPDVVFITAAWGLGENVVQGTVDPDEFYVHKPTFSSGHRQVLKHRLGAKETRTVWADDGGVVNVAVPAEEQHRYCLDDDEVLELAEAVIRIEQHFSDSAGSARPMDVEWAKDGPDGELYIIQARPETVVSRRAGQKLDQYRLEGSGERLLSGRAVGGRIAAAPVRVIRSEADLAAFAEGEILVSDTTRPEWGPVMRRAAAMITNRGGRTCHAAIVARELDVPAVVGTARATETLHTGDVVTVSCAEGETGNVYRGELPFTVEQVDLTVTERPRTHIMVNLGNPDIAFRTAMIPNDGVGLARLEFIINDYVQLHPMAAAHPDRVTDAAARERMTELTRAFRSPAEMFVHRLAEGIATIAAAFYPKPVIVRLSDFKTNEYARLLGGEAFEQPEENPMLGFRGASRYTHPHYADGFALECRALARVRGDFGLTNVRVMVPFCRRVEEGQAVLDAMAAHGLARGQDGLEVYVMCEIPNNVILIDEFAALFDGFSIGSNDLTQLTLGVDRDSEIVAFDFDERDPGVLKMLKLAVAGARRNGRHSGICGQAPSDYPEVAEYLVGLGIDSMSLNPDSVLPITRRVLELERRSG